MNHNLETVPRLYKEARPGADYQHSLQLLRDFKACTRAVTTKSGIMVGLGETDEEILQVMRDMREHNIDMLTIGQYLAPSNSPLAGAPLRAPGPVQDVRGRSVQDGLRARRRGRDGAQLLPRGRAGAQAHNVLAAAV
jgi:lipoic acid synthetase